MKFIIKGRQTGKTTGLIYTSECTGIPIIVSTKQQKERIESMAEEMKCNIPEPVTLYEAKCYRNNGRKYSKFLIDDAAEMIKESLEKYLEADIEALTLTDTKLFPKPKPAEMKIHEHKPDFVLNRKLLYALYKCADNNETCESCPYKAYGIVCQNKLIEDVYREITKQQQYKCPFCGEMVSFLIPADTFSDNEVIGGSCKVNRVWYCEKCDQTIKVEYENKNDEISLWEAEK